MYLVDTSVWVDFLRGEPTPQVAALEDLLSGDQVVGIAPVILQEVLQGADSSARFEKWRRYFGDLMCYLPGDPGHPSRSRPAVRPLPACRQDAPQQ